MSKVKRTLSKEEQEDTEADRARFVVSKLRSAGIRLLALDFDRTIVDIHTAGFWKQGTAKLAEHVRPCLKELIKAALEANLHTCIVTYSMQPALIHDVLEAVLPTCDISKLIIRANSKDWLPKGACNSSLGKEQHIAWTTTELFNKTHAIIHSHEILLVDDDEDNVKLALDFGHQAFLVPEDVTMETICDYSISLCNMKKSTSAI